LIRFVFCYWLIVLLSGCGGEKVSPRKVEEFDEISIMTYNILFNTSNDETLEVLKETGADIIGMQEASPGRMAYLAQKLHFYYHSFSKTSANLNDQDTGILSRFPITRFFNNGVVVRVNPSLEVAIFTVHLSPYPYEPYDFRDGKITTADQAIVSASGQRLPEIAPVLEEINEVILEGYPLFLTGDFNEPSFLDWTALTAAKNMHFGKVVEWPVSKSIVDAGLKDVYRFKFPNAANFPGNTWTTLDTPDEVYDRIDIIYYTETPELILTDVRTVGGKDDGAGITVENYPSDHYAVLATYKLEQ
jgi:endonuclease/exonuclease/phosphatase family metal-dependent hydrolase